MQRSGMENQARSRDASLKVELLDTPFLKILHSNNANANAKQWSKTSI